MDLPVDLRLGSPVDIRLISELMLRAGGGLFEQLLDDIVPGIGAEPLLALALAINQTDSAFGCDNAILADRGGLTCGMTLCFPTDQYRLPEAVCAFVPPHRLHRIDQLIRSCPADSFYIHSLAVLPPAARSGVATRLLRAATELAMAHRLTSLSLHVWQDNDPAMALYRKLGFTVEELVELAPSPRLRWSGPMALLTAPTEALLATTEAAVAVR